MLTRDINPIIKADYPPSDVIRVGEKYYMVSTTMHFYPAIAILESYDLVHWEIAGYVADKLEDTEAEHLSKEQNIYGSGIRVGSFRYHEGVFYITGVAYSMGKSYVFTATDIKGPWEKKTMEHCTHDASLLFDDDGKKYLFFGNGDIFVMELNDSMTGYKNNGIFRKIVSSDRDDYCRYEGAHVIKRKGKYYVFLTYWPKTGNKRRTQAVFVSDSLDGEFVGTDVFDCDRGYFNEGVAQGGLVETPEGDWYAILMQDYEAVGRLPILVPVTWENDMPVFGKNRTVPVNFKVPKSSYEPKPLFASDEFKSPKLNPVWQWNHLPDNELWNIEPEGGLRITTGKISINVLQSVNTLTQRMMWPKSAAEVTVDAGELNNGDYAGFSAFLGGYGFVGILKENGKFYVVMCARNVEKITQRERVFDYMPGQIFAKIQIKNPVMRFRIEADFSDLEGKTDFYIKLNKKWKKVGISHKVYYHLDHFCGCRYALFTYSTYETGGSAVFKDFVYEYNETDGQ